MTNLQQAYLRAKARAEAAKTHYDDLEAEFIRSKDLHNEDGSMPKHLYMYVDVDDDVWTALTTEFDADPVNNTAYTDAVQASSALRAAEDALIDWSLTLIPAEPAEALNANRNVPRIREQLIDLAMRWTPAAIRAAR